LGASWIHVNLLEGFGVKESTDNNIMFTSDQLNDFSLQDRHVLLPLQKHHLQQHPREQQQLQLNHQFTKNFQLTALLI
jgi:hypothetical protein